MPEFRYAVLLDHEGTVKNGEVTIKIMLLNQIPKDAIEAGSWFDTDNRKVYWTKAYKDFAKEQHDGKINA